MALSRIGPSFKELRYVAHAFKGRTSMCVFEGDCPAMRPTARDFLYSAPPIGSDSDFIRALLCGGRARIQDNQRVRLLAEYVRIDSDTIPALLMRMAWATQYVRTNGRAWAQRLNTMP